MKANLAIVRDALAGGLTGAGYLALLVIAGGLLGGFLSSLFSL